jgi:hypothetical protein
MGLSLRPGGRGHKIRLGRMNVGVSIDGESYHDFVADDEAIVDQNRREGLLDRVSSAIVRLPVLIRAMAAMQNWVPATL